MNYSFTPTVVNGRGKLTYSIANKPACASFDAGTGALTGRTILAGTYSDIEITVIDKNRYSDTLGPFSVELKAVLQEILTLTEWRMIVFALT
jgi:hypothetical protein